MENRMRYRFLGTIAGLAGFASILALTAEPASAQAPTAPSASKNWTQLKTPWGDPDLQGTWTSDDCIGTPMNRPANLGNRLYFTEQELAQRESQLEKQHETDLVDTVAPDARVGTGPPGHWGERARRPCKQTSLVVDPPNGQTPDLLPEARTKSVGETALNNNPKADSWEDFSPYIRCISRGVAGSIFPVIYGNGQQIVQGPGYISIMQEMVHEARIIPLDGRPHASSSIRTYMGDPRGHWEGNTLVVETTNFLKDIGMNGINQALLTDKLRIVERFTRTAADELTYEATIEDPGTWARPWTMRVPYRMDKEYTLYEYACHEANYGLPDILKGARATEAAAAGKN
jgi:hypothetical protein